MYISNLAFFLIFNVYSSCNPVSELSPAISKQHGSASCKAYLYPQNDPAIPANIVFQSVDGGVTWQDISEGLPAKTQEDGFFTAGSEVYIRVKNDMYRRNTAKKAAVWEKDVFLDKRSRAITNTKKGLLAYDYDGHFFQKMDGVNIWIPVFSSFEDKFVRTVFETANGSLLVGSDNGIFKSSDNGKTWKHVFKNGWVIDMTEADGVLLCTNQNGILRSADGGEHWEVVISEGGVGIDVAKVDGGFAAITYNTTSKTRRVRASTDKGKTWQAIDTHLPQSPNTATILQWGKSYFCGHSDGIYQSTDKGKFWKLILPSVDKKVFNLTVSGTTIYATLRNEGC